MRRIFIGIYLVISFFCLHLPSHANVFTDSLGRQITLKSAPLKIVSMAPNITEMLYFLGMGDRIVGVTRFSYFPPEARKKPKIGAYTSVNIEKIISLNPDLAIATADGNKRGDVDLLEEAGVKVYVVNPKNLGDVLNTMEKLGKICGKERGTNELVGDLKKRVNRVVRAVQGNERPLVLLVININPLMSVNGTTIHNNIIQLAGGENMAAGYDITYPRINIEEVISKNPEVIIISSMERGGEFEKARKWWDRWPSLPAVRNGNVYLIDSDLIDRPSPRIVKGLEKMAGLIHPEIAWDDSH